MAGDIEDFLRRAAQRREQKPAPVQRQPAPQQPAPRQPQRLVEPEIVEEIQIIEPDILRGETVAEHVSGHIQTAGFEERLSHLGEDVDHSDDRMEAHLHDVFEHDLGQLGAKTSIAEESTLDDDSPPPKGPARLSTADVLAMLSQPDSIRQAIILTEILNRPEDRW